MSQCDIPIRPSITLVVVVQFGWLTPSWNAETMYYTMAALDESLETLGGQALSGEEQSEKFAPFRPENMSTIIQQRQWVHLGPINCT